MSRKIEETTIAGTRVPVVELTALQVDELLKRFEEGFEPTGMDKLFLGSKHLPEFALNWITAPVKVADLTKEHDLAPSEIAPLYDKALSVNSFLANALQLYREKAEKISNLQSAIATMVPSVGQ